jgi:hypothetical protein
MAKTPVSWISSLYSSIVIDEFNGNLVFFKALLGAVTLRSEVRAS